jgi:Ca2+-binding RTX toxin-like protein
VDRDGSIIVGASTLRGGVLQEDGTYVGGDAAFWYEFTGELEAGGTLVINGTLRVEGFRNGDLGIKLLDASELPDVPLAPLPSASDGYTGSDAEDVPTEWHDLFGNSVYDLLDGSDMGTDMWGGDDYFILGDGNDIGSGDLGNDLLEGGAGRDFLHGGQGGDALFGVSRELVDGLFAETEGDGSAGDWLVGAEGDDSLYGTSGSDFMHGGIGTDYIAGGAGNDVIHADLVSFESESVPLHTRLYWSQPDLLPGPDGGDFALNHLIVAGVSTTSWPSIFTDIQAPGDILNRLHPSLVGPDAGEAGDADIVVAGPGSDVVYLGGGDDLASGGAGADRIFGGHGADEMLGEGGNDSLEGGAGSDTLFGGGGDDTLRVAAEEGELSLGEEGNDSIYVTEGSPGEVFVDAGAGNDFVRIEFAHATVLGGDGNDVLQTFWGSGVLIGGGGQDTITAEPGSVVDGGAGNDRITARGSQDAPTSVLWGKGHGSDTASLVHTTLLVEGALPHEIVASRSTIEFPGVVMVINGVPITIGGFIAPATQFQLIGDTATITFLDAEYIGDRSLRVAFEDGTIWEEEDIAALLDPPAIEDPSLEIEGSDAEDLLYGSLEADTFRGGAGDDWLIGDQGHDIYHYAEGDGFDIIDDVDATVANSDQVVFASGIETSEVDVFATGSDYILAIGDGGLRLKGARVAEGAIETIRFGDGTQWSSSDLESLATILPDNAAPEMPESFGVFNVDAGSAATIEIPHDAIVDTDQFDSLTYYAITAEGDPLPDWLVFDATALTVAANPEQANAGTHELLIIAADSNGAAAFSELTISVPGGSEETPSGEESSDYTVDAPAIVELLPPNAAVSSNAPTSRSVEQFEGAPSSLSRFDIPPPRVGEPLDPLYREMTARLDVLLQVGRTNLMERYAEAVREFEERRRAREEPPAPPPPTEQEIMEWNQAMHAWHERHPGFTDVDGTERDGVWTVGWGAGGGEVGFSELLNIGGTPSLANPAALPRLPGAARAPGLTEGFRETR